MAMRNLVVLAMAMAMVAVSDAAAGSCRAHSGDRMVPLVELYTSEGCSSCPPADRWLSAQFPSGGATNAVALAFHVDYWDRLGWKDRFASPAYIARQYQAMRANRATFVYTPQVIVQGRDFPAWRRGALASAVASAAAGTPKASIQLDVRTNADAVDAAVVVSLSGNPHPPTALALAYVDSGLASDVKAGENRGERLAHDQVVRAFATRDVTAREMRFDIRLPRPAEAGKRPSLVAFVQDPATGDVLQTLSLSLSRCDRT